MKRWFFLFRRSVFLLCSFVFSCMGCIYGMLLCSSWKPFVIEMFEYWGFYSAQELGRRERVMMMMITAFGATNVPVATTTIIMTISEIRNRSKHYSNQCILSPLHRWSGGIVYISKRHNVLSPNTNPFEASDINIRRKSSFNRTRTCSYSPCSGRRKKPTATLSLSRS